MPLNEPDEFWSIILLPGPKFPFTVEQGECLHISAAAVDTRSINTSENENSVYPVLLHINNKDIVLCNLSNQVFTVKMDLKFSDDTELIFSTTGKATVHLTGCVKPTEWVHSTFSPSWHSDNEYYIGELEKQEPANFETSEEDEVDDRKNWLKKHKINSDQVIIPEKSMLAAHAESSGDKDGDKLNVIDEVDLVDTPFSDGRNNNVDKKKNNVEGISDEKNEKKNSSKEVKTIENNEAAPETLESRKKVTLKGGVIVEELKKGNGPIANPGNYVTIYYTYRFEDGNIWEECNSGPGLEFLLGDQHEMRCLNLGLNGMKVGAIRRIISPPFMTLDCRRESTRREFNEALILDVELKNVRS